MLLLSGMEKSKMPKIAENRVIFESKRCRVGERDMEFANGEKETWEMVEQKGNGGARVLGLTHEQELIFVQEYRGAADKYVLRFPTGMSEDGEEPSKTALRELEEETGFVAETIESLGVLDSTGGYYKDTPLHLFFATNLKETGRVSRERGEQDMEIVRISLEKAFLMA